MKEFSRVFNRKTFLLLLILCLINTAILILCADPAKEITQTGEELDAYLEHYPEFIDKTVANGEVMSMLNVQSLQSPLSLQLFESSQACPDS